MPESFDFVMERGRASWGVMLELAEPPIAWTWEAISTDDMGDIIHDADNQVEMLVAAESATMLAGAQWNDALDKLLEDAALGIRLARVKFKDDPIKLRLFEGLGANANGRAARYAQALDFEASWEKADATWVFKPTVTVASFKTRRKAIKDKEDAHVTVYKSEQLERAILHDRVDRVNRASVDWYEVATATFPQDTVAGQLIRTVPTTYDPNRPPGDLFFLQHSSPAPNQVRLVWRAARGERFYILGQGPGAGVFDLMLDGVTDAEWLGQGLVPGLWRFKGYAGNQFGNGPESSVVEVSVAVAAAA